MNDCLFCKIAGKEIFAEIIYESDAALAFLDIHPLTAGHAVVVPKGHYENIVKLPDELVKPLFLAVKKVTALLNESLAPRGFTIGINHGKVSGQTIDHLHIHVIPRYEGDGGKSIHSVVHFPSRETVQEIRSRILSQNADNQK
ncbi:MAG: HIT family protein [Patescibacteria group bacterium]|nr:HIT family protein [Patescibacteria group bacterium]